MTTGYVLLDSPNPHGDHFYRSRVAPVLASVIHITAGLEDMDGVNDQSAEKTAAYAASTDRPVSWHSGSDADSNLLLLPDDYTAFQCVGYNSKTIGHEISKRSPDWRVSTPAIVERLLVNATDCLRARCVALGIPPRKATRAELDAAFTRWQQTGVVAPVGYIGHWELDPSRRADPGLVSKPAPPVDTFPWTRFLELLTPAAPPTPGPPQEDDVKLRFYRIDGKQAVWAWDGIARRHITDTDDPTVLASEGFAVNSTVRVLTGTVDHKLITALLGTPVFGPDPGNV